MKDKLFKLIILMNCVVNTYCNLVLTNNNHNNHNNGITYWTIEPESYICMCTPNSVLVNEPKLNATVWDTYCSNLKQCIWNKHEIIIKTWYHPN